MNPNKTGLALGAFLGVFHLSWSVLIALGVAQPFMDFIFRLHMVQPVYVIMPFNLGSAATLVVVTAVLGYVFGYVFAAIWNKMVK